MAILWCYSIFDFWWCLNLVWNQSGSLAVCFSPGWIWFIRFTSNVISTNLFVTSMAAKSVGHILLQVAQCDTHKWILGFDSMQGRGSTLALNLRTDIIKTVMPMVSQKRLMSTKNSKKVPKIYPISKQAESTTGITSVMDTATTKSTSIWINGMAADIPSK